MSKKIFTREQIQALLGNKNVARCSERSITYNPNFKLKAVRQYYDEGLSPTQIFIEAEFDIKVVGKKMPERCLGRWRKKYKIKGAAGLLKDNRGQSKGGGRPKTKGLTDKEKIGRLEATVAYLRAENDFLAKLRAAEKE